MGAILAVFGEPGDPELPVRLERMIACSPYRGSPVKRVDDGIALGAQVRGDDASLGGHGHCVVTFNGWVGNWDELAADSRLDLRDASSDAERVAIAFEATGESIFARLRGEFAVVIVDRRAGKLVAARDVYGVRPLYFHQHAGRTYMASEINQVLAGSGATPQLDEVFLASWLVRRYGAGEDTMYASIRRVVPGHAYTFAVSEPGRESSCAAYWFPPPEERARGRSEAVFAEELRFVLDRAVGRTLAPRPGAVALSGGMDSSTIWALVRRRAREGDGRAGLVGAVSLLFPGFDCDESIYIAEILAVTGGEAISVDAAAVAAFPAIEGLIDIAEGPFVPTLYHGPIAAEAAKNVGWEVMYYGFGGDEWLTGNPSYLGDELRRGHMLRVLAHARSLPLGTGVPRLRKLARYGVLPVNGLPWRRRFFRPAWLHPLRQATLLEGLASGEGSRAGNTLQRTLATHRAASYFGNAELVAAHAGVELRCPLHDLDLVEFAFRTPGRVFMGGRRDKHLLRVAMTGLLPALVVDRRTRAEFSEPIRRGIASFARQEDIRSWRLVTRNIVVAEEVERMRAELAAGGGADGFYDFMNLAVAERLCRWVE